MQGQALRTTMLTIAVLIFALVPARAEAAGWLPLGTAGLTGAKLFDLGVTDYDGDGNLDLFTTNHKYGSSLLDGDGAGGLAEAGAAAGLSPTPQFPGFEDLFRAPDIAAPGLYVFATTREAPGDPLQIRTTATASTGTLTFAARNLTVERSDGATAEVSTNSAGNPVLTFDAGPGAAIDVVADHLDLPIGVAIDPPLQPTSIRIGADAVPASARSFELDLRDRHAFGFADFDGDGRRDLFISSGGLGGEIADPYFTGKKSDELLLARGGGYVNATTGSGLVKGSCRGRGVQIADFDGDGILDVMQACEDAPPLIHLGDGDGRFSTTAGPPAPASAYRVLDLIGDRRPEVVAAGTGGVQVWRGGPGAWRLAQQVTLPDTDQHVTHLALGDIDGDGDPDLLAVAAEGNTILRNSGGRLRRLGPQVLGLPGRGSSAAAFVDYDNDGNLDLDLVPQGLMRVGEDGKFTRTGRLAYQRFPEGRIRSATVSWPDLNGDGRRDPISARGRGEFSASQVVDARLSTAPANENGSHWLEVDLVGPAGNREALGAAVTVEAGNDRQTGWVGQGEDSRGSSGHYRLYYGLGRAESVDRLVVAWPDGSRSKRADVSADRLLTIRRR